jgi:hypothetical protein
LQPSAALRAVAVDRPLAERPVGQLPHPGGERGRRDRDHPRGAAGERRIPGDREEAHGQEDEEGPERAATHPGIMGRAEGRSSTGRAPVSKTGGCRFESCRPCKRKPRIDGAPVFSLGDRGMSWYRILVPKPVSAELRDRNGSVQDAPLAA